MTTSSSGMPRARSRNAADPTPAPGRRAGVCRGLAVVVLVVAALLGSRAGIAPVRAVAQPGDVAMFRGDAARTGAMPGPGPAEHPVEAWRKATGSDGSFSLVPESSPTVVGGAVYVGSADGHVYALDANTSAERWRFATGDAVGSSPAVFGGVVYVGGWDGHVYALDAATGRERWRFATGEALESSPAAVDGVVYVGSGDGNVYSLDAATGRERWRFAAGDGVGSSPAVVGGVVYVGSYDHNVYALDAATGAERWRFATGDRVFSSPAVVGGLVYVGSQDGNVYAITDRYTMTATVEDAGTDAFAK